MTSIADFRPDKPGDSDHGVEDDAHAEDVFSAPCPSSQRFGFLAYRTYYDQDESDWTATQASIMQSAVKSAYENAELEIKYSSRYRSKPPKCATIKWMSDKARFDGVPIQNTRNAFLNKIWHLPIPDNATSTFSSNMVNSDSWHGIEMNTMINDTNEETWNVAQNAFLLGDQEAFESLNSSMPFLWAVEPQYGPGEFYEDDYKGAFKVPLKYVLTDFWTSVGHGSLAMDEIAPYPPETFYRP